MSNDGLDVELMITIARAEKQIDQFINSTKKKFEKLNLNPMGGGTGKSGNRGGGSPTKDYEKDLERMRKFYDKSSKERKKRLDDDVRAEEKAQEKQTKVQERENEKRRKVYEKSRKDREKRLADDEKAEKRSQAQIEKIREDALHRYKLMEIQRNRYGQNANEESLRQRMDYEQRLDEIIRRTNSNNLEQQKRAIQLELAQQRKALDQKVMSERQAAAEELAGRNAAQKRASKFNNTMFQVQQSIEDFSYAGFRGASNNLALMANQLGGPGGTIALMGLMATTMTPTIAKMMGFGEETKKAADRVKELTKALIDQRNAKLEAEKETSQLFSSKELQERKKDLRYENRDFERKRKAFNRDFVENSPMRRVLELRKLREDILKEQSTPTAFNENAANANQERKRIEKSFFESMDTKKRLQNLGIGGKSFFDVINEIDKKEAVAQRDLAKSVKHDISKNDIATQGIHKGRFKAEVVEELENQFKQERDKAKEDLNSQKKLIEERSKALKNYSKNVTDVMDLMDRSVENIGFDTFKVIEEKPSTMVERIEKENEVLKDTLGKEVDRIKSDYEEYLKEREDILDRVPDKNKDEGAVHLQELVRQEEARVTEELRKQNEQYQKKIEANNQLLSVLEDVKDKHSDITKEIENSVKAHQKKIQSLQETLNLTKESYQFDKMSAQSKINEMKIEEQGKKQMTHAQRLANRKFDPMIRYLKFMSQSPVFGQMASQKLQAVEGAKANFLSKAQSKINASVQNKMLKEQQSLLSKQSTFLQDKANAAGGANEFEKQQKYLEQLQSLKMQAAGSAKTPKQAEKYLAQADKIQNQIVQSMNNQISTEKQSLNELTKIESQLIQIKEILKGDPNSPQAKQAQQTIDKLQKKIDDINKGKVKFSVPHPVKQGVPGFQPGASFKGKTWKPPVASAPKYPGLVGSSPEHKSKVVALNRELALGAIREKAKKHREEERKRHEQVMEETRKRAEQARKDKEARMEAIRRKAAEAKKQRSNAVSFLTPGLSGLPAAMMGGLSKHALPAIAPTRSASGSTSVKSGDALGAIAMRLRSENADKVRSSLPQAAMSNEELRKQMYERYNKLNSGSSGKRDWTRRRIQELKGNIQEAESQLNTNADRLKDVQEEYNKTKNRYNKNVTSSPKEFRSGNALIAPVDFARNSIAKDKKESEKRMLWDTMSELKKREEIINKSEESLKKYIETQRERIESLQGKLDNMDGQNVQGQQVTQAQTNQATISHATINSATINGVVNNQKQVPVPVVSGGSSSSNVVNQRFGSLNVNVQGPTLPNIPRALQRQARNSRTRMG